ncbi:hypothetical protein BCR37DRAFT_394827 [Protomyces lactucae-debilis]|uniref:Uncharacterized protein n=1 Tax=Protomyces lactucae-debilis TaxID=2754530 RepID=A0A1Y2F2M3_PROLT|nr:uncharacterized protein BCR37DRAFT_394827 [Protomyces lactucae-debilis]ORY77734.1 hypothetical protein BCR37DRAFT_394827 [Protomyces lactucae-debilis]
MTSPSGSKASNSSTAPSTASRKQALAMPLQSPQHSLRGRSATVTGTPTSRFPQPRQHSFQSAWTSNDLAASDRQVFSVPSTNSGSRPLSLAQKVKRFLTTRSRPNLKEDAGPISPLGSVPQLPITRLDTRSRGDTGQRIRSDPISLSTSNLFKPPRTSDGSFVTAREYLSLDPPPASYRISSPTARESDTLLQLLRLQTGAPSTTDLREPDTPSLKQMETQLDDPDIAALRTKTAAFITSLKTSTSDFDSVLTSLVMFQRETESAIIRRMSAERRKRKPLPYKDLYRSSEETSVSPTDYPSEFLTCVGGRTTTGVDGQRGTIDQVTHLQPPPPNFSIPWHQQRPSSDLVLPPPALEPKDKTLLDSSGIEADKTPLQVRRCVRKNSEDRQRNRKSTVIEARCYTASTSFHEPIPVSPEKARSSVCTTPRSPQTASPNLTAASTKTGAPESAHRPSYERRRRVPSSTEGKSDCSVLFV